MFKKIASADWLSHRKTPLLEGDCGNIALKSVAMIQFLILVVALLSIAEVRA
jgi:hypothetical protein